MEVIEKRFEKFQLLSMGVALFGLIVGIVLIGLAEYVNPQVTNKVLAGIIVIGGLTSLVKYFYDGFANSVYKFEIVSGIAMLITGIFMVFDHNLTVFCHCIHDASQMSVSGRNVLDRDAARQSLFAER